MLTARQLVREEWGARQFDTSRAMIDVSRPDGSGWILKQPEKIARGEIDKLDREAAWYGFLSSHKHIAAHLPQLRLYDAGIHVLVIERVGWTHGLRALRRADLDPALLGRAVADWLTALHQVPLPGTAADRGGLLTRDLPWLLAFTPAGTAKDASDTTPRPEDSFFRLLEDPELVGALHGARDLWTASAIIHADAKLSNLVIDTRGSYFCYGIDWADARCGDPAWDVAGILQSALDLWLNGITVDDLEAPLEGPIGAGIDYDRIRVFGSAFLAAYVRRMGLDRARRDRFVLTVARYVGARLLQTVFENVRARAQHIRRDVVALRIARSALIDPASLAQELGAAL